MSKQYVNVIVDIVHTAVDRVFQYEVPEELLGKLSLGMKIRIPFGRGNTVRDGYIIGFTEKPDYDPEKIKQVQTVEEDAMPIEGQLIRLAAWMKEHYGSTMIQALKTVLPMKKKMKPVQKKYLVRTVSQEACGELLAVYRKKKQKARVRFLEALMEDEVLPYEVVTQRLRVSPASFRPFLEQGICRLDTEESYRNPVRGLLKKEQTFLLNEEQRAAVSGMTASWDGKKETCLLHGITGSGKTEVYMELIRHVIKNGRQAIVLIPEIALTYQTVMRFYRQFGERVSIVNSRLSAGEKSDQFERARTGRIDIMIGPRSALFTPFPNLGLIIIDEEHETAYKSETVPKYHAIETAIERCRMADAMVVLGSATPSASSYYKAQNGEYLLFQMRSRAKEESVLPSVEIVDLREELKAGNRTIFSRRLKELLKETLERKEQALLFLNRRGYAGFISCRSCGEAVKCPHCDVSLTQHWDGKLKCHYCGYETEIPKFCPSCGSRYIAGFGTGTQKVEAMVSSMFPEARILRMDTDTTKGKGGHDAVLAAFADGKADILVGTQMIVKGHDFPNVTLVGILAADLSLHSGGYEAGERTFQLLTQAAGRAGRDKLPGQVVIQSYAPSHYSVEAAASQDYESFYWHEILYRRLLHYPPVYRMMSLLFTSKEETAAERMAGKVKEMAGEFEGPLKAGTEEAEGQRHDAVEIIGPAKAAVSRINDSYRYVLYAKCEEEQPLLALKEKIEQMEWDRNVLYQFDME
ncbi:primosomal protein N' [Lacrimispora sp. NSJ-141]|uniref:Replication restart protein PriA n=1 Tax=Lientehia hominis TaxID=2897778 RepID=A0AAP2RHR2_9FIRM|nr:primosomal protein N' [Lientehia hominis]MCD2492362.1 primosomal protein N' [Lientehia hominis]